MGRWLGIDHGTRRIGLAVGNTTDGIATPLTILDAQPHEQALRKILDWARQYQVEGLVVGLPLNMDGTEGPQAALARALADELADQSKQNVQLWDERLSSFQADAFLAGHLTRKKKKARQDALAAAVMLQEFLNQGREKNGVEDKNK